MLSASLNKIFPSFVPMSHTELYTKVSDCFVMKYIFVLLTFWGLVLYIVNLSLFPQPRTVVEIAVTVVVFVPIAPCRCKYIKQANQRRRGT